jgi:hypothetical protein
VKLTVGAGTAPDPETVAGDRLSGDDAEYVIVRDGGS